ncbi:MAG: hypothetical protein ACTSUE_19155 [Promethearchaeota archaeon]
MHIIQRMKKKLLQEKTSKKVFLVSISIHLVVHWFIGFVYLVNVFFPSGSLYIDFYHNFMEGVGTFINDPFTLYQESGPDIWIFRNLPTCIFLYLPFYFIPSTSNLNLILFSTVILAFNIGSVFLFFKIARTKKFSERAGETIFKSPYIMSSFFLLPFLHINEYYLGQSNSIAGFFVLLGLYFELNEKRPFAVLCWSFSINFKISTILLLILAFERDVKKTFTNFYYAILPHIPNIFLFLSHPNWIFDFISINITKQVDLVDKGYQGGYGTGSSGTLSVFLYQNFGIPMILTTFITITTLLAVNLIVFHRARNRISSIDTVMIIFLIVVLTIPIFWSVHALYFFPVLVLWHGQKKNHIMKKWLKILVTIPLVSFMMWVIFPLNPFLFLIPLISIDFTILHQKELETKEEN